MSEHASPRSIILPLIFATFIIALDQATKILIVRFVEYYYTSGHAIPVIGDFLRIIHVSNTAIAFSIGRNLAEGLKTVLFIALPSVLMVGIIWYYLTTFLPTIQRWALASMIGGGLGNIIDRIFRADGVVDFIDVKMYGVFGLERWPTFNVADSAIVVGAIVLISSTFLTTYREQREQREQQAQQGQQALKHDKNTTEDTHDGDE